MTPVSLVGACLLEHTRIRGNLFDTIKFETLENIAVISLNRPEQVNAFNVQMRDDLWEALEAITIDTNIRTVIFRGEGDRGFCSGADLTEFGTTPSRVIAREARYARDIWALIRALPIPVIAALHGYVIGSGIEMALCCDIRFSTTNAIFALPEVPLGMIPFAGGSQTVPRTIGRPHALDLLLTGRRISAEQALGFGLIHQTIPQEQLMEKVFEQANILASLSPTAVASLKKAVNRGIELPLEHALELERRFSININD